VPGKPIPAKLAGHLLQPPAGYLEQRLPMLKVTQAQVNQMDPIVICGIRKLVTISPALARPKLIDIVSQTVRVSPKSLDELKELVGVPARAYTPQAPQREFMTPTMEALHALPAKLTVSRLQDEQRTTFFQSAHLLLHGPTSPAMLERPGYQKIAAAMLQAARQLPVLLAPNLVVCDGEQVDFSGYAALYFNNVVVQGGGGIILGNNTKLHAYQIKRI